MKDNGGCLPLPSLFWVCGGGWLIFTHMSRNNEGCRLERGLLLMRDTMMDTVADASAPTVATSMQLPLACMHM